MHNVVLIICKYCDKQNQKNTSIEKDKHSHGNQKVKI